MSLFESNPLAGDPHSDKGRPLAERMRPDKLEDFVGQEHILGPGKPLRAQIERDELSSIILWGPPGVGKTTLARLIARLTKADFVPFSAVLAGIKEIKAVMADAERARRMGRRTVLFVDEIHRFNKAQQDAVLPHVERGVVTLIGATTENPSFEVNAALLSRTRVFTLKALSEEQVMTILRNALQDNERGLGQLSIEMNEETEEALQQIAIFANGDARTALNALELAVEGSRRASAEGAPIHITLATVEDVMQHRALLYDKGGDQHYDTISALHKSLRGSDPDAALYWLARMIEAGEDPLYIVRRLIRFASEDVGMADPSAITQSSFLNTSGTVISITHRNG